jgi:protein-disulfide isomerase
MSNKKLQTPIGPSDHIQGNEKAVITLLEYGDYQCPYCGMAYPVVKRLQRYFGRNLRFVFRNFPLTQAHKYALTAAVAAEAAGEQKKFWEMHDTLFENQDKLTAQDILEYATSLNLDLRKFDEGMRSQDLLNKVRADYMSGEMSGVDGTPCFYINDMKFVGPSQFDGMRSFIEDLLDNKNSISL